MDNTILFIVQKLSDGGAERVVSVLSNQLAIMNKRVVVLIYFPTSGEYCLNDNVRKVYLCSSESEYHSLGFIKKVQLIRKSIKEINPDYLVPFLYFVGVHTQLANLGFKGKVIQTVRNDPHSIPEKKSERILRNIMFHLAWRGFVQNNRQLDYFPKSVQKKLIVLPNPVSGELFEIQRNNVCDSPKIIISAGRLQEQKNFPMLIRTAKLLKEQKFKFKIMIYGEGYLQKDLSQLINDYDVNDCCKLCGRSHNMKSVYTSADIFVMTSNFEGMPNSLMEAMASGLPCISTDCPTGPAELISDGQNGFLIGLNNDLACAEKIKMLLSNSDLSFSLGKIARQTIEENYSSEIIAKRFLNEVLQFKD